MSFGLVCTVSTPTNVDIWFVAHFAKLLGHSRVFDLGFESAIRHHVFGGMCFGAALFVFWSEGARPGEHGVRGRIVTTLLGATAGILLTFALAAVISWLPPSRNPVLAQLYPAYLMENINDNSFPSQSTALYAAVAAGIYSVNRIVGSALWFAVAGLVSLPRVFVGGHYPSDVLAGLLLGILGYYLARTYLEPGLEPHIARLFAQSGWPRALVEVIVFVWILQISVEFGEFVWVKGVLEHALNR